jgi:hypothetical protein
MKQTVLILSAIMILAANATTEFALAQTGPSLAGCPVFPADNVWNTPIDNLPVDPRSSTYISAIGADKGVHPDFGSGLWEAVPIGIPCNVVPGTQPRVNITFGYADESDPGPYPIPPDAEIEGGDSSSGVRQLGQTVSASHWQLSVNNRQRGGWISQQRCLRNQPPL